MIPHIHVNTVLNVSFFAGPMLFVLVKRKLCVTKASSPLDVYEIATAPPSEFETSLTADVDILPETAQQNHSLPYRLIECKTCGDKMTKTWLLKCVCKRLLNL